MSPTSSSSTPLHNLTSTLLTPAPESNTPYLEFSTGPQPLWALVSFATGFFIRCAIFLNSLPVSISSILSSPNHTSSPSFAIHLSESVTSNAPLGDSPKDRAMPVISNPSRSRSSESPTLKPTFPLFPLQIRISNLKF